MGRHELTSKITYHPFLPIDRVYEEEEN